MTSPLLVNETPESFRKSVAGTTPANSMEINLYSHPTYKEDLVFCVAFLVSRDGVTLKLKSSNQMAEHTHSQDVSNYCVLNQI